MPPIFETAPAAASLEFTALHLWEVRLLMYSFGPPSHPPSPRLRRDGRAAHIQCWSSSTSGLPLWSPANPCQPSKRRDHFRFCRPHHEWRACFRSSRSLSVPLAATRSLLFLPPSDRDKAGEPSIGSAAEGVRGHARPCRQRVSPLSPSDPLSDGEERGEGPSFLRPLVLTRSAPNTASVARSRPR